MAVEGHLNLYIIATKSKFVVREKLYLEYFPCELR